MPPSVYLDPKVWGPHYWFFLHTLAMTYPHHPNTVTKKKYYELIQNMPQFIPVQEISNSFSKLLDEYPITPYLDDRESLIRWVWFIHNKINQQLEKPQISLNEFYVKYYEHYKPKNMKQREYLKLREKCIYIGFIVLLIAIIYYLYDK
jgi:FAD-linked sulfhydryl oxidase